MPKLTSFKSSSAHRCIIYGAPKAGKSLLAGKLAEYYNIIWVDMENGHEVLFQLPEAWQERINLIHLRDTRSYPIGIETCLKMVKGPVEICHEHGKCSCMLCKKAECKAAEGQLPEELSSIHESYFSSVDLNALDNNCVVVFDSLTQLTNSAIAHMTKNKPDDYKLDWDDWGNLGKLLDVFLSHIQQADYNVIVISHETEAETEGKKKTLVPVGGTRNFSRNVAKYFDHVIYAERKNRKHVFASSTTYATTILSGSRTNVALESAENEEASLLQIFKPELYKRNSVAKEATTVESSKSQASDALARLMAKKGK